MTTTDDKPTTSTLDLGPLETALEAPAARQPFGEWVKGRFSDQGKRRVTIGWLVLAASLVVYFFVAGIPWSTDWVFIYITAGLIISSLSTGVKWKRLLMDWLPLFLVLTGYGLLRGYAAHTLWGPFIKPQVWFDTHVFGGLAPTVQLQRWLYSPGLHFWDYLVWCCYMSHFFVSFIIAGVRWKTNYRMFRRFVPLFVAMTFLGYVTYVLYPAMPPWMAADSLLGFHYLPAVSQTVPTLLHQLRFNTGTVIFTHNIPGVTRILPLVLDHMHFHTGAAIFTGGDKFDNNVAAMPSLHGGYPMLICLVFWKGAGRWKRVILAAYPICMAFSLVYAGEHFVIDIFVGWLYAAATVYFGSKVLDRWKRAASARNSTPPTSPRT